MKSIPTAALCFEKLWIWLKNNDALHRKRFCLVRISKQSIMPVHIKEKMKERNKETNKMICKELLKKYTNHAKLRKTQTTRTNTLFIFNVVYGRTLLKCPNLKKKSLSLCLQCFFSHTKGEAFIRTFSLTQLKTNTKMWSIS